jgi:hypothetical protein
MKGFLSGVLSVLLIGLAITIVWLVWFNPQPVKIPMDSGLAEKAKAVDPTPVKEGQPGPAPKEGDLALYGQVKDYLEQHLKAPRTAVFPDFNTDPNTRVVRHGNNVVEIYGYVDSENSFGAMIRTKWRVAGVDNHGQLDGIFFARVNGESFGEEEDIGRRAKGLPTLEEERMATKLQEEEAAKREEMERLKADAQGNQAIIEAQNKKLRPEVYEHAVGVLRSRLLYPKLGRFSSLQPADDQYSISRRVKSRLWETRGVVDYVDKAGKRQKAPWRVLTLLSAEGNIVERIVFIDAPDYTFGDEATALEMAR